MPKYQVWECKIVIDGNEKLPNGFDFPPRRSVIEAIERAGIDVISCFSGWGGTLTETEEEIVDRGKQAGIAQ